jgi:hypothetical protein
MPLALAFCLLAACSPPLRADTGIQGQVTVGPMCPVVQEGQDCPDQPYQATLTILNEAGSRVMRFTTDADGAFRVPLAPGSYILRPEVPEGAPMPIAAEQAFTVAEGSYTELKVIYDSGIR